MRRPNGKGLFLMQWDILSNGGLVEQVAQLTKGQTPGNALSLFKAEVRLADMRVFTALRHDNIPLSFLGW